MSALPFPLTSASAAAKILCMLTRAAITVRKKAATSRRTPRRMVGWLGYRPVAAIAWLSGCRRHKRR